MCKRKKLLTIYTPSVTSLLCFVHRNIPDRAHSQKRSFVSPNRLNSHHCMRALSHHVGLISLSLCLFTMTACVNTDSPEDENYTTYTPDMAEDSGTTAEDALADLTDTPTDMSPDATIDEGDASVDMPPSTDMGNMPTICQPNNDGIITRQEVPLQAGLSATYSVATDIEFSTAGEDNGDGTRTWDMSGTLPGDTRVIVEARDPATQWFFSDFPDATYFTALSSTSDLLGVFEITEPSLNLLGVVSPEDGFYDTNVEYDPAVRVLNFPIEDGKTWQDETSASGTVNGVYSAYSEDYTSTVDARGILKTPYADFNVFRIRVELERTVGFYTTTTRTYIFVSECFGTVGTIVSEEGEEDVEFTQAAEVRRLSR